MDQHKGAHGSYQGRHTNILIVAFMRRKSLSTFCGKCLRKPTCAANTSNGVQKTCARIRQIAPIFQIKVQIAKLDAEIDTRIAACPKRARKVQILQSIPPKNIPGVGAVLARTILVEMPEIGTLICTDPSPDPKSGAHFSVGWTIITIMRKLIILANTLIKQGREWSENYA